ncbi:methylenetetrahydrofolate--tRNA-(uracil(54)-C(5))-methyltransferase (FADH(2)-oxidizing) TrmFO [Eubacteriales bacterium OttesenSCG-928-M02]|nr:methylenetetrahydrofolate--tRNA-(uracil(54)-C(5))-methyltransferase (FADH(2)-oxidizing) TrmFO [Eubacteriales bacterium OttesenSCG-928-M02]
MHKVTVIGGGLAGAEAAMQLANRNIHVTLFEMKPGKFSSAHSNAHLAELVCSNSLKSQRENTAPYLLKWEMARHNSIVLKAAEATKVKAGGALAVDRDAFSAYITEAIEAHPSIEIVHEEVTVLPEKTRTIVATGPLTSDGLFQSIQQAAGMDSLYFFDAAAPIVEGSSVDMTRAFFAGRYDQDADYLNCPLTKEEYDAFYEALLAAERAPISDADKAIHFEGCMPIEVLAGRGEKTPLFGPMSPKGLTNPTTGRWPYAVVQLRKEDEAGRLLNIVGFQTNLKFSEQKRVFSMIPALKQAEFVRYGVMHRNTYLHSPKVLDEQLRLKGRENISFVGQITGVEGYVESAASGIIGGIFAACEIWGKPAPYYPPSTMMGALLNYVTHYNGKDFQPMNGNFGILSPLQEQVKGKKARHEAMVTRAQKEITRIINDMGKEEF